MGVEITQLKTCTRCGKTKPETAEYFLRCRPVRANWDGPPLRTNYHKRCKVCESEAKREAWAVRRAEADRASAFARAEAHERAKRMFESKDKQ